MSHGPTTLILASRSARRAELLRDGGVRFVQVAPPFEDPAQPKIPLGVAPETLVLDLAVRKAHSLFNSSCLDRLCTSVVLAADTVVVNQDGLLLGQPSSREHAHEILQQLIGVVHRVVTGVVMLNGSARDCLESFADSASVQMGSVSSTQLTAYLESGRWQGKAGGYNLFEMQSQWPLTVQGDPTTVVGLPMKKLSRHLAPWSVPGFNVDCTMDGA